MKAICVAIVSASKTILLGPLFVCIFSSSFSFFFFQYFFYLYFSLFYHFYTFSTKSEMSLNA